jgi:hypothetical protein
MKQFDRELKNRARTSGKSTPKGFKIKPTESKRYLLDYRRGKYLLEDITLKKQGHSQKFK